jgi:hypothetical protein
MDKKQRTEKSHAKAQRRKDKRGNSRTRSQGTQKVDAMGIARLLDDSNLTI